LPEVPEIFWAEIRIPLNSRRSVRAGLGDFCPSFRALPVARSVLTWVRKLVTEQRIVAVGLLTDQDLELLGNTFRRLWPVEHAPAFSELLQAIDEADAELSRRKEASK
jgi:hypothetical protein